MGVLNGLTILRFAHAYESGGGVEQHLADLNKELSRRNRITTIQMQLTLDPERLCETEEKIGDSLLLKVPLLAERREIAPQADRARSLFEKLQQHALNLFIRTQSLNNIFIGNLFRWRRVPRRTGEPKGAGVKAAQIIHRFKVDLVVLHTIGGADASEIIEVATSAQIPIAIVNHFSNDRLGGISVRQQVSQVHGVGGASSVGVPNYLKREFWNLSDAVDIGFYRPDNIRFLPREFTSPVIYAPARVTPEKGQADVIKIASILKRRGLNTKVIFAGRIDSAKFETKLREMALREGLSDSVVFLGPLSLEEYRDWYGIAHVMVMPTYHQEGMPRTLIESQAMEVPPVVYNIGGMREGLINGKTGFLVRLGDLQGIAMAVESLIRNTDLHQRMALAGRKYVEQKFSLQAFAERHERFYLHVLKNRSNTFRS